MSSTPILYNSAKLCKPIKDMECKRNKSECEREVVVGVFREGKFELLALTKTKLKRNGKVSWCGVNGIIAGVQEMERAKEGVSILLTDVWHSEVIDFGYVSSRILWIKFKSKGQILGRHGPDSEYSRECI